MTLSKRNSRTITVKEVTYRWKVSARSQVDNGIVKLVVEPPEGGQRLAIEIPCRDPYLHGNDQRQLPNILAVTPKLVRQLIDDAIRTGWNPQGSKTQPTVRCVVATMQDEGVESGATCHISWQCPLCSEWYSDEVQYDQTAPIMTTCGRGKRHPNGHSATVVLFW